MEGQTVSHSRILEKLRVGDERRYLGLLLVLSMLLSCNLPGPMPFKDVDQLRDFLPGRWKESEQDLNFYWEFEQNGEFEVWVTGQTPEDLQSVIKDHLPKGVQLVKGRWRVENGTEVELTDIRSSDGEIIADLRLPLQWLDGKIRIGIGGYSFIRHPI